VSPDPGAARARPAPAAPRHAALGRGFVTTAPGALPWRQGRWPATGYEPWPWMARLPVEGVFAGDAAVAAAGGHRHLQPGADAALPDDLDLARPGGVALVGVVLHGDGDLGDDGADEFLALGGRPDAGAITSVAAGLAGHRQARSRRPAVTPSQLHR
jgi:hypothetical protein